MVSPSEQRLKTLHAVINSYCLLRIRAQEFLRHFQGFAPTGCTCRKRCKFRNGFNAISLGRYSLMLENSPFLEGKYRDVPAPTGDTPMSLSNSVEGDTEMVCGVRLPSLSIINCVESEKIVSVSLKAIACSSSDTLVWLIDTSIGPSASTVVTVSGKNL